MFAIQDYEYIVVGGGSAGATVAGRLAQQGRYIDSIPIGEINLASS